MNNREKATFQELAPQQFETVRPLFAGFDYSLSIHAAIEGNSLGRIFVDNVERPCTAFALTVEGYLLTGDHTSPVTIEALRTLLAEQIFTGKVYVNGNESMSLAVHPQTWEAQLPALIPTHMERAPGAHASRVAQGTQMKIRLSATILLVALLLSAC